MCPSLFIPGCSIDLTGEEEPSQPIYLKRGRKLRWIDVVVFNVIAVALYLRVFQPLDAVDDPILNIGRKAV